MSNFQKWNWKVLERNILDLLFKKIVYKNESRKKMKLKMSILLSLFLLMFVFVDVDISVVGKYVMCVVWINMNGVESLKGFEFLIKDN